MNKHYLNINYDGTIFEYSGSEKEGFVKHTSSTGKESYRKYYNKGVEGKLMWINRKNNPNLHNREEIEIVLGADNATYYLNFVVYGQDNFLDTYTEKLVTFLPKLEKGVVYNINNWFIKKGDTINGSVAERNAKGLTIKVADNKIEPALTYKTDENPNGNIPALVWKEKGDKKVPSAASKEERSDYLYEVLIKESERLKWDGNSTAREGEPTDPPPSSDETDPHLGTTPRNPKPSGKQMLTMSPNEAFEKVDKVSEKYDDLPFA